MSMKPHPNSCVALALPATTDWIIKPNKTRLLGSQLLLSTWWHVDLWLKLPS